MNDIADRMGVTKAALYKHYKSKQEILDSIVEKMNRMDQERIIELVEKHVERFSEQFMDKNGEN